jgi:hypothetical protein
VFLLDIFARGDYSTRHQIACFKATERLHPPLPYSATQSHHYSVASFATLQVLSCLHSPRLRCSCCDDVRFCCDLEAPSLAAATIEWQLILWNKNHLSSGYLSLSPLWHVAKSECGTREVSVEPHDANSEFPPVGSRRLDECAHGTIDPINIKVNTPCSSNTVV